jgi:hypothetical protein
MSIHKALFALAAVCAALLVAPVAANAATTTGTSFKNVPVSGSTHSGKAFHGHLTVTQFVTKHGKTYANGILSGKLGNKRIKPRQVSMPTKLPAGTTTTGALAGAAQTCPILHLDLGPLTLNLLGLNVHLNEVILDITATSGPGNLLGNLLCSVSNLLNQTPLTGGTLTGLLNIVQQLVNTSGLLNL